MKIGELAAMVYYYYATRAEDYPELWAIDSDLIEQLQDIEKMVEYLADSLPEEAYSCLNSEQRRNRVLSQDYAELDLVKLFGKLCFNEATTGPALYLWYEEAGGDTPANRHFAKLHQEIAEAPQKWAIIGRGVHAVYYHDGSWHRVHAKRGKTFLGKLKDANLFDSQADANRELQRRRG